MMEPNKVSTDTRFDRLRKRAEKLLRERGELDDSTFLSGYEQILEELQIYHTELELQNQELQDAMAQYRESRDRYADLFNSAPVAYVLVGSDGMVVSANDAASELFETKGSTLVGRPLVRYVHDDDHETFYTLRARVFRRQEKQACELRVRSNSGVVRYVKMQSLAEQTGMNDERAILISLTDISELKKSQLELDEAHRMVSRLLDETESRYKLLVENASEGIVVTQEGKLKFVNPVIGRLLGRSIDSLADEPFDQFLHPGDRKRVMEYHRKRFEGVEVPKTYELRVIGADGSVHWLQNTVVMIDWDGDRGSLNILTDITERKRFEQELAEKKNMLQTIQDNIPVMIAVYDDNARVLSINKATEEKLGWTEEEFRKIDVLKHCYPDEKLRKKVRAFMQEAPDEWMDVSVTTRSGESFESSWYGVRLSDGIQIGIGIDISPRKEAERRAQQAIEQLEIERNILKSKNVALRELIEQFEGQRNDIQKDIVTNLEETALPLVHRLEAVAPENMKSNLEMLRKELVEIASPFLARMKSETPSLSVRQREICRMIKGGMSTKEIAHALNISQGTVQKHREIIRRKLGLSGSAINLAVHLQSMQLE